MSAGVVAAHYVAELPTPKVLLRAADITGIADGAAVPTWNDSSGNGYNATQATASRQPLYRAGSGSPYLEFDGVDDYYAIPYAFTAGQAATVFVRLWSTETGSSYRNVFDGPAVNANPMLWFDSAGKVEFDQNYRTAAAQRGTWVKVAMSHPAGSSVPSYYVNGSTVAGGATYSMPAYTPQWFNRGGNQPWKGYVSELRIYNVALSAAEIATL